MPPSQKRTPGDAAGQAHDQAHEDARGFVRDPTQLGRPRLKLRSVFTREELRELTRPSDLAGAWAVARTWLLIAAAFALVAYWPTWWSIAVALIILGGRQLALAILMHEAAHRSLFATRWLNDVIGTWLCAAPAWQHLEPYRRHHLSHHAHTNERRDPDLGLTTGYPTSRASVLRKFARDLVGWTGLRRVQGLVLMDLGFLAYTAANDVRRVDTSQRSWLDMVRLGLLRLGPVALTNYALFRVLHATGNPWLFALWIAAYMTTFSLFVRVRSMAEHAALVGADDPAATDPLANTRTTLADPIARLTVAPHHVNYHLEHHLLMTVPHHKLPRLHRMLRERGVLERAPIAKNYVEVLRQMVVPGPAQAHAAD